MIDKKYIEIISKELNILLWQIESTISLSDEGCTVPFISRYRKERTGGLDEFQIQTILDKSNKFLELDKRKDFIIETIEDQGKMTTELHNAIATCIDEVQLEDLYLPYKVKRKTRAEIARNKGLEPLAKIIMSQKTCDVESVALKYLNDQVSSVDEAIDGAKDIIAEWVSENMIIRNKIRSIFNRVAVIESKVVKGKETEGEKYENYFSFTEPLKRCISHRLLAIRRGEKEGFLRASIDIEEKDGLDAINHIVIKGNTESSEIVEEAAKDSYKRLLKPSIETEFASISKSSADDKAIEMFSDNLRQLLFAPPLGRMRVMGVDPGFRTGCKVVCLDEQGNLLHNDVIYPTAPKNDFVGSARKIQNLIEAYKIDAIALGNGTASRETESFLKALKYNRDVKVYVVSESGASIYSASKIARDEFPDKDVTVRGAVSIGRRLLDPLSELVKIDPKSIGVGQYQHDVDQTKLKNALEFTVSSCVNSVGVNVNTASKELLMYVSGIGLQLAQNITTYRAENGAFEKRSDLKKVPRMGDKAFQQSAAFLRIPESKNPLDNSAIHPERYQLVETIAKDLGCKVTDLINDARSKIDVKRYITEDVGLPTLQDITKELEKPGRDPRKDVKLFSFDENIKSFEDLKEGIVLNGIVTNITQFGAFIDIGVHENGLVHISEMRTKFISSPSEVLKLNQHVRVKVIGLDSSRKRIALTMKGVESE